MTVWQMYVDREPGGGGTRRQVGEPLTFEMSLSASFQNWILSRPMSGFDTVSWIVASSICTSHIETRGDGSARKSMVSSMVSSRPHRPSPPQRCPIISPSIASVEGVMLTLNALIAKNASLCLPCGQK